MSARQAVPPDHDGLRLTTPADASDIARLASELGYPVEAGPVVARLGALASLSEHRVWLVGHEGVVAGWIHAFIAHRVTTEPFAEIGGLVVGTAFRRAGLGRRLVQAAADWATSQGAAALRVRTRTERADARSFYESLGFQLSKEQAVFAKKLGSA